MSWIKMNRIITHVAVHLFVQFDADIMLRHIIPITQRTLVRNAGKYANCGQMKAGVGSCQIPSCLVYEECF